MKERIDDRFRRQYGVVSRAEALADGLSHRQIRYRVSSGLWIAPSPGVYRHAAHPVTPEQRILAAVLAAGPGAVASHQAAAYLWGLLDWREARQRAAISVLASSHPRPYGFDVHRVADLEWARVRTWKGIDCTDPLRTLCDLGPVVNARVLDRAVDRGLATRLVDVKGLQAEVDRRSKPGRRGVGILRERLALRGFVGAPHPSVLESRTLSFLARHRLAVEQTEVVEGPDGEYRIDFSLSYPVMLEVDGYVWHYSPEHKARDDQRRNQLRLSGIELYVSNWRQIVREEAVLARTLRRAITGKRSRNPVPP